MLRRGMMAGGGGGGGGGDPYWANVVSLLHFDGADGSTTFTDQTGKVWTPSGNAQIDTAHSKFGGAAGLFDGAGDYISTPSHADFNFGAGDFTVEGWARTNGAIAATSCFVGQWLAGDYKFTVGCATSGRAYFSLSESGGSGTELVSANGAIPTSTWFHFAGVRSGSTHTMYVNGVSVATGAISGALFSSTSTIRIGSNGDNQAFNGHVDEVRITKGIARYTGNFTPPSAPFPDS